jgi:8-oxo-dGTP pyrophosphatase MutT (NUDIX family)
MPEMLEKRLLFVTGKGGVGKSTVAASLGLAAAARGKRTIVCEIGSQEHTSRLFNRAQVGFHEVQLEDNLWTISIDPDESMREYVLLQLKVRAMRDLLFRSRVFTYLTAATPGLKELVTIGKIWELAQLDRKVRKGREYDLVIVDAPATGHGIGFLQTPRTFANIARVGPIHAQAQELDRFITDHASTGTAIVSLPEEMPVNETATLERELREETGFEADRWVSLGHYVVDPNYGCGAMHAFIAHGARKVTEPDSGDLEEQELLVVPMADAIAKLEAGEIVHLASAAALALAAIALGEGR